MPQQSACIVAAFSHGGARATHAGAAAGAEAEMRGAARRSSAHLHCCEVAEGAAHAAHVLLAQGRVPVRQKDGGAGPLLRRRRKRAAASLPARAAAAQVAFFVPNRLFELPQHVTASLVQRRRNHPGALGRWRGRRSGSGRRQRGSRRRSARSVGRARNQLARRQLLAHVERVLTARPRVSTGD